MGIRKLENAAADNAQEIKPISAPGLGQHCPSDYPRLGQAEGSSAATARLGQPFTIRQAAALIGVSCWTIRQTLMPQGLPHFRCARSGRLIFYEHLITAWVLKHMRGAKSK